VNAAIESLRPTVAASTSGDVSVRPPRRCETTRVSCCGTPFEANGSTFGLYGRRFEPNGRTFGTYGRRFAPYERTFDSNGRLFEPNGRQSAPYERTFRSKGRPFDRKEWTSRQKEGLVRRGRRQIALSGGRVSAAGMANAPVRDRSDHSGATNAYCIWSMISPSLMALRRRRASST